MTIKDISYVRGNTYALKMTIQGLEDITIDKVYLTVKENSNQDDPILQKSLDNGITPLEEQYQYNIIIDPSDTEDMEVNCPYYYDITVIIGNIKKTIVKGSFTLEPNYTKASNEV